MDVGANHGLLSLWPSRKFDDRLRFQLFEVESGVAGAHQEKPEAVSVDAGGNKRPSYPR